MNIYDNFKVTATVEKNEVNPLKIDVTFLIKFEGHNDVEYKETMSELDFQIARDYINVIYPNEIAQFNAEKEATEKAVHDARCELEKLQQEAQQKAYVEYLIAHPPVGNLPL